MPFALLIFVAMPIIEIAVLLRVGDTLGWFPTLSIVILTAILGTAMLRQQGLATLNKAKQRMNDGEMPAQQLLEGLLLLVGGVLLLTPGFVTDAFGFFCLIPFTRQWLAGRLASRSMVGMGSMGGRSGAGMGPGYSAGGTTSFSDSGKPVGSGATAGASKATESSVSNLKAGGNPSRNAVESSDQADIEDAEYKPVDD